MNLSVKCNPSVSIVFFLRLAFHVVVTRVFAVLFFVQVGGVPPLQRPLGDEIHQPARRYRSRTDLE